MMMGDIVENCVKDAKVSGIWKERVHSRLSLWLTGSRLIRARQAGFH